MFSRRRAGRGSRAAVVDRRAGAPQRKKPANTSLPLEISLAVLGGFPLFNRDVSIGLVGNHLPAAGQAGQNRGFGSTLRQQHETMAFIRLGSAPVCMVHGYAFAHALIVQMSIFSGPTLSAPKRAYDETCMLARRLDEPTARVINGCSETTVPASSWAGACVFVSGRGNPGVCPVIAHNGRCSRFSSVRNDGVAETLCRCSHGKETT